MHFTQKTTDKVNTKLKRYSHWHDTALNGMVEISYPVNLYESCHGQPWKKVTVEFGVKAGLTTFAVDTVMNGVMPGLSFINIYAPWDVKIQCTYLDNYTIRN